MSGASKAGGIPFEPGQSVAAMPRSAVLAAALLCILFGANAVAIKVCLTGIGVFTTAGLRFGLAAAVIGFWALLTGRPLFGAISQWRRLGLISVLFIAQLNLFYLGLSRTDAARAALLVNLQPFLVLILAHFFVQGEPITMRKCAGMLLGFAGISLVFAEDVGRSGDLRTGDLLVLSATVFWAMSGVYVKRVFHHFRGFHVVFYPMVLAAPVFLLEGYLLDAPMIRFLNTPVVLAFGYQSLITASFGFVAWNTLLKRYGAVPMHSFLFLMPVSGVFLAGVVLGEPVTWKILSALAMVAAGIALVHVGARAPIPSLPPAK